MKALLGLAMGGLGLAGLNASALPTKEVERQEGPSMPPRAAFLTQSNLADVGIAPSGRLVAFLKRSGKSQSLWLLDTATAQQRMLVKHSEATRLHWSADSKWVFLVSGRTASAVPVEQGPGGGVISLLGGESGRSVLGLDRSQPAALLVRQAVKRPGERQPSSFHVLRLTPSQSPELLFDSPEPVDQFIARQTSFARAIATDHFSIRRVDPNGRETEVLRCVRLEQCSMLSSPKAGELLLTGDVQGNYERLLRLDASGKLHTVHQDPKGVADLANVAVDPLSGEALVTSYRSAGAADYAVAAANARDVSAVRRQLPPGAAIRLGIGKARWLVAETGDRLQHARWHLYDQRTGRLQQILADVERPARQVDAAMIADRVPISFRASDGMLIRGFLALPRNRPPSQLPMLVHVHGGPWSHFDAGYSTMTQFLVSRGYAVFEPNFRGSTGYGRAYMNAGKQDFGNGRVHKDIIEGTRALLDRGIGDRKRVGIIGSSFGGYSALQGVTFAPSLFRVAVAGMPPSDFGWVMRWQTRRELAAGHEGIGLRQSLKQLGMDPENPALSRRLTVQSPLTNAARLTRPLLIVAGGKDQSVPIRSVVDYAARLKSLGRRITLFVDPESGHRIDNPETQEQYLFLISTMLGAQLGGSEEPALSHRHMLAMKRKVRVDDWALARHRRNAQR